ncbi:MAG: glycosyltransferase family 4 protein [Bacteroidales bacterium]|nr:glycosyltransferase family 4 protein [Bacteroidales bacterium]
MRIMHIIPGSGGSFYCGNCLRDSKFVEALRASEHEVVKIPMYLPLFADEHDISGEVPVFYGAISIYLKQQFPVFRKAPGWVDKLLNSKPMLKFAARMAGSTRARGLEEMTISMLLGEEGQQQEELSRMIDWMVEHCNPDVIHLSNALLLGLAHELHTRLNVPVICSLQDEDQWIDVMQPSTQQKVWDLMSDRGNNVDAFIAVSDYYAEEMTKQMDIPTNKLHSVYIGVYPEDYEFHLPSQKKRTIGYVSRMSHELGLDILVDAFILLKKDKEYADVELHITGGATGDDKQFIHEIKKRIHDNHLNRAVKFHGDFEEDGLREFFNGVSLVSVPVRKGEAFGIYLLESMASGVPVVQPALGAFPEILKLSGGGITYEPNTPEALADAIKEMLSDPAGMDEYSRNGRKGVENHFHVAGQVKRMIDIYERSRVGAAVR